jgi:hypothetical protein
MRAVSIQHKVQLNKLPFVYTFLLGLSLCFLNIYLASVFVFGSLVLNPMVLLINAQLMGKAQNRLKPMLLVVSLLALLVLNDIGVSILYEAPHTAEMDLWIKLTQLLGILPLLGIARKHIMHNHFVNTREKIVSLLILVLGSLGYYSASLAILF